MTKERLLLLMDHYLTETLTEPERLELAEALENEQTAGHAKEIIGQHLHEREFNYNPDLSALYCRIELQVAEEKITRPVYKMKWLRYAVAAVILGLMVIGGGILFKPKPAITVIAKVDVKAPISNRATLTLSNGQTVYLDSALNGQLAMQGGVELVKLADGKIAYTGNSTETVYNTLTNPNGSKAIDIALSDGSHVWLNAGSSIVYPVSFALNKERRIQMTGEAYYEISHRDELGFVVQKNKLEVKVLGTHFDVKAYDNEQDLKVTLLEGSVKVSQADQSQLLKPNQQAIVKNNTIQLIENADTEQAIAWKNGVTSFHGADIATVLHEIERWYDITTEIKGAEGSYTFYADVKRNAPLKDILQVLEDNKVKYEYDAQKKKLTVLP